MSSSTTRHWKCDRCGLVKDQPGNAIGMPHGWITFRWGQHLERQLCEACAAALGHFLRQKTHEDRYRTALQAIVDYEPGPPELELQWSAWLRNCELTRAVQHTELCAIARKALEEPEP
jgi:hypothetical protein